MICGRYLRLSESGDDDEKREGEDDGDEDESNLEDVGSDGGLQGGIERREPVMSPAVVPSGLQVDPVVPRSSHFEVI